MSTSTSTSGATIIDTTYRLSSPPADTTSPDHDSDSTSSQQAQREREREIRRQKKKKREKGKDKREKEKDKHEEERHEKEQDRLADSRKASRDRTASRPSNAESYGSYQVDDLDVDDLNSETHILDHVPSLSQPSSSSISSSFSSSHLHQHHIISIPENTTNATTTTDEPKSLIERQADEARVQTWLTENGFNANVRHQLHGYNGADLLQLSKTDCKDLLGVKEGIRLYNRLKWTKQAELEPNKQFGGLRPEIRAPYGLCDELGCQRGATATCDAAECGRALCTAHSHKYLLTSAIFCRACYQVSSLSKVVHVVAQQDAQCIIS